MDRDLKPLRRILYRTLRPTLQRTIPTLCAALLGCAAPAVDTATAIDPIAELLQQAEEAAAAGRLLPPAPGNAADLYRAARKIAPTDQRPPDGLDRIVEPFTERARRAIDGERWATARSMLDRASLADPEHPGIAPLRSQIELLSKAQRHRLDLTVADVRARRPATATALARLGEHAREARAITRIRADSDSDGRWIYAQLNRAPGSRRIRAEVTIARPPRVDVLVLPEAN